MAYASKMADNFFVNVNAFEDAGSVDKDIASKAAIRMPSAGGRRVSLSDIIAATIGEEARSCDMVSTNETAVDWTFNFLDNICETSPQEGDDNPAPGNHQNPDHSVQTFTFQDTTNPQDTTIHSIFSENSNNACDAFDSILAPKVIPDVTPNTTFHLGEEEKGQFEAIKHLAVLDDSECSPKHTDTNTHNAQPTSTDAADESVDKLSDDSDLEDSMHFVDPDDMSEVFERPAEPVVSKRTRHFTDSTSCPAEPVVSKRLRHYTDTDRNSCPAFVHGLYNSANTSYDTTPYSNHDTTKHVNDSSSYPPHPLRTMRSRSFSGSATSIPSQHTSTRPLNGHNIQTGTGVGDWSFRDICKRGDKDGLPPSRKRRRSLLESPDHLLSNNPYFDELKSTLLSDCQTIDCPQTLFDTLSQNCPNQDVYARERQLQSKFSVMQGKYPQETCQLLKFYQEQSARLETERLQEIHDIDKSKTYRKHLNTFYDNKLHMIMERVEKSLGLLSAAKENVVVDRRIFRTRPLLSRRAVTMMEEWYARNLAHPYPGPSAIEALAAAGQITTDQVKKWFANKRNRNKNTKPVTEIANMKRKRQYSARW